MLLPKLAYNRCPSGDPVTGFGAFKVLQSDIFKDTASSNSNKPTL